MAYYPSKQFFDMAFEGLENCYRSDRYVVASKMAGKDIVDEYFLVAGPNSTIHIFDFPNGYARIIINGKQYRTTVLEDALNTLSPEAQEYELNICEALVAKFNELRKNVMILDYCVSELRKMPKKDTLKSDFFIVKTAIEQYISGRTSRVEYTLPSVLLEKIQDECDLLTEKKRAIEDGKINEEMAEKIRTKKRFESLVGVPVGKGICKQNKLFAIGYISDDLDPLEYVRDMEKTVHIEEDPAYEKDWEAHLKISDELLEAVGGESDNQKDVEKLKDKYLLSSARVVDIVSADEASVELTF